MANVLRPACLSDLPPAITIWLDDMNREVDRKEYPRHLLKPLYDAEWRKRGFLRSP